MIPSYKKVSFSRQLCDEILRTFSASVQPVLELFVSSIGASEIVEGGDLGLL